MVQEGTDRRVTLPPNLISEPLSSPEQNRKVRRGDGQGERGWGGGGGGGGKQGGGGGDSEGCFALDPKSDQHANHEPYLSVPAATITSVRDRSAWLQVFLLHVLGAQRRKLVGQKYV